MKLLIGDSIFILLWVRAWATVFDVEQRDDAPSSTPSGLSSSDPACTAGVPYTPPPLVTTTSTATSESSSHSSISTAPTGSLASDTSSLSSDSSSDSLPSSIDSPTSSTTSSQRHSSTLGHSSISPAAIRSTTKATTSAHHSSNGVSSDAEGTPSSSPTPSPTADGDSEDSPAAGSSSNSATDSDDSTSSKADSDSRIHSGGHSSKTPATSLKTGSPSSDAGQSPTKTVNTPTKRDVTGTDGPGAYTDATLKLTTQGSLGNPKPLLGKGAAPPTAQTIDLSSKDPISIFSGTLFGCAVIYVRWGSSRIYMGHLWEDPFLSDKNTYPDVQRFLQSLKPTMEDHDAGPKMTTWMNDQVGGTDCYQSLKDTHDAAGTDATVAIIYSSGEYSDTISSLQKDMYAIVGMEPELKSYKYAAGDNASWVVAQYDPSQDKQGGGKGRYLRVYMDNDQADVLWP